MNWKEFLKLNWKKIILFVVFLIFSLDLFICNFAYGGCGELFIIAGVYFLLDILSTPYMILFVIPIMIFDYLLSCFVFWTYDKYKGVKK